MSLEWLRRKGVEVVNMETIVLEWLKRAGIPEFHAQRGIIVPEINVKKQLELLEVRRELERLVVRSAARWATLAERKHFLRLAKTFEKSAKGGDKGTFQRIAREFNALCASAARNEYVAAAIAPMHALSWRFWCSHCRQLTDLGRVTKLHADVARAIAYHYEAAAAEASDKLIRYIEEFTQASVSPDA